MALNPPVPMSKKSCPVARQVEIRIVTDADESSGRPARIVKSISTTGNPNCNPVATGVGEIFTPTSAMVTTPSMPPMPPATQEQSAPF